MIRSFEEWWSALPDEIKERYDEIDVKSPQLNHVNYIWVTNFINKISAECNPTVEELLDWVKSGQVDAKRR